MNRVIACQTILAAMAFLQQKHNESYPSWSERADQTPPGIRDLSTDSPKTAVWASANVALKKRFGPKVDSRRSTAVGVSIERPGSFQLVRSR